MVHYPFVLSFYSQPHSFPIWDKPGCHEEGGEIRRLFGNDALKVQSNGSYSDFSKGHDTADKDGITM